MCAGVSDLSAATSWGSRGSHLRLRPSSWEKPPWPEQRDGQEAAGGSRRRGGWSWQPRRGQGAPGLRSPLPRPALWGHPATKSSQAEPICLTQISQSSNPAVPNHLGQGEAVPLLFCAQGGFQTPPPSSTHRPPSPCPCFRDSEARWDQQLAPGSPKSTEAESQTWPSPSFLPSGPCPTDRQKG